MSEARVKREGRQEKMKLSKYIDDLERVYQAKRADYEKARADLQTLEAQHKSRLQSGELSAAGKAAESVRYTEQRGQCIARLQKSGAEFRAAAAEVRSSADKSFSGLYLPQPAAVDMGAVELLKSGMLTKSELLQMAEGYKAAGNQTMYRMIGRYVPEQLQSDPEMHVLVSQSQWAAAREDLQLIDTYTQLCSLALRDDPVLADGQAAQHTSYYNDIWTAADRIEVSDGE